MWHGHRRHEPPPSLQERGGIRARSRRQLSAMSAPRTRRPSPSPHPRFEPRFPHCLTRSRPATSGASLQCPRAALTDSPHRPVAPGCPSGAALELHSQRKSLSAEHKPLHQGRPPTLPRPTTGGAGLTAGTQAQTCPSALHPGKAGGPPEPPASGRATACPPAPPQNPSAWRRIGSPDSPGRGPASTLDFCDAMAAHGQAAAFASATARRPRLPPSFVNP